MSILPFPFALEPECLNNKVIMMTGASGGLGQEVAKTLARFGAELILVDKQLKQLEQVYDDIMAMNAIEPTLHAIDLMHMGIEQAQDIQSHVQSLFGRLDGLIHCAGFWGNLTPIEHYSEKTWLEIIQLNLNAPFLLTKYCLPLLNQAPHSQLVFTLSDLAQTPKPFFGAFGAAQAGLHALMQTLSQENERQPVNIMGFNPKAVKTPTRARIYPGLPDTGYEPKDVALYYVAMMTGLLNDQSGDVVALPEYQVS